MRPKRPSTLTKKCDRCSRRRPRLTIEWHSDVKEWRCSNVMSCNEAIDLHWYRYGDQYGWRVS